MPNEHTHGAVESPTALNSLHNYEMRWLCFPVIALSSKCFSKLQWCHYNMLMIKSLTPAWHFRKIHPFLFILRGKIGTIIPPPFITSISNQPFIPKRIPVRLKKKSHLYILLFCFPTLQLCESWLKQFMGVPKSSLFQDNQMSSVDKFFILVSTKQCYKFDLASF